jgi:hypothetical protein
MCATTHTHHEVLIVLGAELRLGDDLGGHLAPIRGQALKHLAERASAQLAHIRQLADVDGRHGLLSRRRGGGGSLRGRYAPPNRGRRRPCIAHSCPHDEIAHRRHADQRPCGLLAGRPALQERQTATGPKSVLKRRIVDPPDRGRTRRWYLWLSTRARHPQARCATNKPNRGMQAPLGQDDPLTRRPPPVQHRNARKTGVWRSRAPSFQFDPFRRARTPDATQDERPRPQARGGRGPRPRRRWRCVAGWRARRGGQCVARGAARGLVGRAGRQRARVAPFGSPW